MSDAGSGSIPTGEGWAFELKYDGFRALVSTENGLEVTSRRNWEMTDRAAELRKLARGLVLDGRRFAACPLSSEAKSAPTGQNSCASELAPLSAVIRANELDCSE